MKRMEYIFSDCYDTLIIRREHPFQVLKRWASCVNRLYPNIDSSLLYADRMNFVKQIAVDTLGIFPVYDSLAKKYISLGYIRNSEQFISDMHCLELECEKSTIYANKKVVDFLKKQKKEGSRIFCITDYHLPSDDMRELLRSVGIDFVEEVFSSASYGITKQSGGGLYRIVLNKLNVKANQCLMIGDNKQSDVLNANESGLNAKYIRNTVHKNYLRIKNKVGIKRRTSLSTIGKDIWKNSNCYDEFVIVFYTFCVRLYHEVKNRGGDSIIFLAREGQFLKKCFETYQRLCIPEKNRINTEYLKISRRAIYSVQREKCLPSAFKDISVKNYLISISFTSDEAIALSEECGIDNCDDVIKDFGNSSTSESIWKKIGYKIEKRIVSNREAFEKYVHQRAKGRELVLVDVGWNGRMQQGLSTVFKEFSTVGYYIGTFEYAIGEPYIERHGLILDKENKETESKYYYIFRSNTQFCEQFLAGSHGSACFYELDKDGNINVHEKWEENEKKLYNEVICYRQKELLSEFMKLCTYHFPDIELGPYEKTRYNKEFARVMLRSALVQSRSRLNYMEEGIKGFVQNFQQQSYGMEFKTKEIHESYLNLLIHPDRFVRYIAKLGVVMDEKKLDRVGRFLMRLYYCWTRLILGI